jgi:hypothetical protein
LLDQSGPPRDEGVKRPAVEGGDVHG